MDKIERILEIYNDELTTLNIKTEHGIASPMVIENEIRLAERIINLFEDDTLKRFNNIYDYIKMRLDSKINWTKDEIIKSYMNWVSLENSGLGKPLIKWE